jgi:hypothetical protein
MFAFSHVTSRRVYELRLFLTRSAFSLDDMNSLYTSGVRQTNSLQADLERLRNGDNSPALLGAHVLFLVQE